MQSGFADRGTSLSDWSINGGPNAANNMLVDGTVASNSYYPDLNANLAVDAVQEFKVQSGSMSAEYGFTLGGVINVATKAGTNQFHGTAYEFVRNNIFDARNAFAAKNCRSAITSTVWRSAGRSRSRKSIRERTARSFWKLGTVPLH